MKYKYWKDMRMKYFHVLSIMKEILLLLVQRIIRAGYGKMVQQQRPQLQQQNENYIFIIYLYTNI
jgi:hypothetical protein